MSEHAHLRALDARARTLARTAFDAPLVLEAGAGTGKTTALVGRIVAWLLERGWDDARGDAPNRAEPERIAARALDRVLAITFTDAAAADMDAKIRAAFAQIEAHGRPIGMEEHVFSIDATERAERARHLRAALDRPVAQTIHAWCKSFLAEHPLEAGLHPAFEVDPRGRVVAEVAREVVESEMARAFATVTPAGERGLDRAKEERVRADWIVLANRNIGPDAVEEALVAFAIDGARATDLAGERFTPAVVAEIVREHADAVDAFLRECGPLLDLVPGNGTARPLAAALRAAVATPELATKPTNAAELSRFARAWRELFPKKFQERLEVWARAELNKGETKAFADKADVVIEHARRLHPLQSELARIDPELTEAARRILERATRELRLALVARGIETFGDLLRDVRDLLRDDPAVCARLRARTRQVLVDEFQDTDPLQCDLVRSLALDPRHGTPCGLFVVGDPKQSIYGFRRADLAAYDAFLDELRRAGGSVHPLSVNFRSTQTILDEVARAIEPVMRASLGVQPAFQPLAAHRDTAGAPVEWWVAKELDPNRLDSKGKTSGSAAQRIEARFVASELRAAHASGIDWKEMAILLRTTSALDTLLEELRRADIPYDVAGDRSYYRRREIVDAAALLACIVDPADHLALLAFLRSPFVGLPDAALLPLWSLDFAASMSVVRAPGTPEFDKVRRIVTSALERIPRDVAGMERIAGFEHSLDHAIESIACARASFARDPLDTFVERLRTLFLLEGTASARYLGSYRLANLERFFAECTRELDASGGDVQALLRFVRSSVANADDAAEARPRDAAASAVSILTIHKSKGLDFRQVFVLGLHRRDTGRARSRPVALAADGSEFVLFGAPTRGFGAIEERARARDSAERVRLLYVAMTRAKDRLVLSGSWEGLPGPKPASECTTMLQLLATAVPMEAREFVATSSLESPRVFDHANARYVLASNVADVASERSATDVARFEDVSAVVRDTEILRALGESAARRARRPLVAIASDSSPRGESDEHGTATDDDERDEPWSHESLPRRALGSESRGAAKTLPRAIAAAVGTAIHRALERFDMVRDFAAEARDRRADLARLTVEALRARERATKEDEARALLAARDIFDRFTSGALARTFDALRPRIVARELPILALPSEDDSALNAISGSIDLVYRDPDGTYVVVDYKTELGANAASTAALVAHHRPQIELYRRALRAALELERLPRGELWFLASSRIEVVE